MELYLQTTEDDRRNLYKTIETVEHVSSCHVKEPCTISNPSFIIDYKAERTSCNYLYVPSWNRYYFIDNITVLLGNRMLLSCTVDALQTYQKNIEQLQCCITRQELIQEPFLADEQMTFLETYDVINRLPYHYYSHFTDVTTENKYCFILGVAGGANNHLNDIAGYTVLASEPADWSNHYPFYFVNKGDSYHPDMAIIGDLISSGQVSASDASNFNTMQTYYGAVYERS